MGVTAQWLKFSLNKFRERFQIREIREIKDPQNISAIRYYLPALGCSLFTVPQSLFFLDLSLRKRAVCSDVDGPVDEVEVQIVQLGREGEGGEGEGEGGGQVKS